MARHEVYVPELNHKKTREGKDAGFSLGSIIVQPPITPGEFFESAVYGRVGHGVSLHHVVTTSEATVFLAGSTLEGSTERRDAIFLLGDRIKQLADHPEKVIELMDQNPFPQPPVSQPEPPVRYKRRSSGRPNPIQ